MPKIRNKQYLKVGSEYRKKSGILTRSLKNVISKEINSKSYFKERLLHNNVDTEIDIGYYDDNDTKFFIEKLVNPVIPLEENLKDKSIILHTPNEFDTTYKIEKITTASSYNKNLSESYLKDSIDFIPYDDSTIEEKIDLQSNKEKINIDLNFNDPCRLSLNKQGSNQTVTLNGRTFNAINSSMVYFDNTNNKWDYLGDIQFGYFDSVEANEEIPLSFNCISTQTASLTNPKIDNQALGVPVNTFGFPFSSRYHAMDRHLIKMNKFINRPFVVEKIKVSFSGTNLSEIESGNTNLILNSLNFFILNQRKNLNSNSFTRLDLDSSPYTVIDNVVVRHVNHSIDNIPFFSNIENINTPSESIFTYKGSQTDIALDESSPCQRELVAYLNLVNFSSGSNSIDNIDYDSIKRNADYFHEEIENPSTGLSAEFVFNKKTFTIDADVRTPVYHETLDFFPASGINYYSKFYNRTGTEYNTERSLKSDFTKKENAKTSLNLVGSEITLGEKYHKSNPYVLSPSDNIVIGFSFNPSASFIANSNYSRDIFMLHDKIRISLIGSYYSNEEPKKLNYSNHNIKNLKRINYYNAKNSYDDIGLSNIYLNTGAYYDRNKKIIYNKSPDLENAIVYENLNSGVGNANLNIKTLLFSSINSFCNFNTLNIDNEQTLLEDQNDIKKVVNIKITYFGSSILFDSKYMKSPDLYEDTVYIFDTSSTSLIGRDIKLCEYGHVSDTEAPTPYETPGITYIGTTGSSGSYIKVEPRKIGLSRDLYLFFVDINYIGPRPRPLGEVNFLIRHNSKKKNKSFYDYRRFGMPSNKLYYYTYEPYTDTSKNKSYYTASKKFRSIYLEDIVNPVISYNIDQYCRISTPSPFVEGIV